MTFNWIDTVITAVLLFFVADGWETGLIVLGVHLSIYITSLLLAVKYHAPVGDFITEKFAIPRLWTTVLGYLIVSVVSEAVLSRIVFYCLKRLPKMRVSSHANHIFGAILSAMNGLVIISFILLLMLALPLRGTIRSDIRHSLFGSKLVMFAEKYGGKVKSSLDELADETIKFLTIQPQSSQRISLPIAADRNDLRVSATAEAMIVALINRERVNANISPLQVNQSLVAVAENHSRYMFESRYFSHYDSEGHDASYRLNNAGVSYRILGENLAYAPDVTIAHNGLMESEGHRRNILDPQFRRIGIGIIESSIYGLMFTQLFTD